MSVLWTSAEAAAATGGAAFGDWAATGISIDTRSLVPGDLFVALSDRRDGHEFVREAMVKGAVAALVSRRPSDVAPDTPLLLVDDTLKGLENLARAARRRFKGRVVAVTGSAGKTGTKEMLRTVLQAGGARVHAAEKSYNNHWGVPLTLARLPAGHDFAVVEIGMNAPGEIEPLARMARPHVAIVTTVAPVHLAAFENLEGIAEEKGSIFNGLEPGGWAVFNGDLSTSEILLHTANSVGARVVRFGASDGVDIRLVDCRTVGSRTLVEAMVLGRPTRFELGSPGRHLAMNALGVLGCAAVLSADMQCAAEALSTWLNVEGRGQRSSISIRSGGRSGPITLIDESYNANPASVAIALDVLASALLAGPSSGRRVAFLGDMLELGRDEVGYHRKLAELEAISRLDAIHCVGPLMQFLHEALPAVRRGIWTENAEGMARQVAELIEPGDVVMVKGSNGLKMQRVVDAIRALEIRN